MILTLIDAEKRAEEYERGWDRLASAYADLYPKYIHEFLEAMDQMDRYRTKAKKFRVGYRKRILALSASKAKGDPCTE